MTNDDVVFLVGQDQALITMVNQPYDSEDLLQTIVERYPEVLTGGSEGSGKRLALVKREQAVADVAGGKGRWSLDHLFVDSEGIPTLVEVKRSTDTRIRREVVGQMLDYAANGVSYWPIADLQVQFESTHAKIGSEVVLSHLLGKPADPAEFWQTVADNLAAGRIRMVFLADEIARELQRIIEFLNEQMARAEVIGVEVRQYVGGGHQTLVPRILGATARSQQVKGGGSKQRYDDLIAEAPDYVREVEVKMRDWAQRMGFSLSKKPTALGVETNSGVGLMQLYPGPGWESVEIYLSNARAKGFDAEADWIQDRLSELLGKRLTAKSPNLPCRLLHTSWDALEREVLPRYVELVERAA